MIKDNLHDPLFQVSPGEACDLFEYSTLRLICRRPQNLADYPDLNLRLRGALGRALHKAGRPVAHRHDPHDRISAFDLLYGDYGRFSKSADLPKPMALRGRISGDQVMIDVHLAGSAMFYGEQVLDVFADALENGISLNENTRHRTAMPVLEMGIQQKSEIPVTEGQSATLTFRSPLCVRSRHTATLSGTAILLSMAKRVQGLGRWIYADIEFDWKELKQHAAKVELEIDDLTYVHWQRHTIRQGDIPIPMNGYTGPMRISKLDALFAPLLAITEKFGIGSHAAMGFGSFELAMYP